MIIIQAGEVGQESRAIIAIAEDQGLVPGITL